MKYDKSLNPYEINPNKEWTWSSYTAHGWNFHWNSSGDGFMAIFPDNSGSNKYLFKTDIGKWDDELKTFLTDLFSSYKDELLDNPLRFLTRLSPTWRKDVSEDDMPLTIEDMP